MRLEYYLSVKPTFVSYGRTVYSFTRVTSTLNSKRENSSIARKIRQKHRGKPRSTRTTLKFVYAFRLWRVVSCGIRWPSKRHNCARFSDQAANRQPPSLPTFHQWSSRATGLGLTWSLTTWNQLTVVVGVSSVWAIKPN